MGPLLVAVVLCTILLGFIPVVLLDSCETAIFRALPPPPLQLPLLLALWVASDAWARACAGVFVCWRLAAARTCCRQRCIASMPAPWPPALHRRRLSTRCLAVATGNLPIQLALTTAAFVLALLYMPASAELDSPLLQVGGSGGSRAGGVGPGGRGNGVS